MTACNQRPPEDHPFHGSMVACHYPIEHPGPHAWEGEPSVARRALDRLLATFPQREVLEVAMPDSTSPWLLVTFVGSRPIAIWRRTGATFQEDEHGAVEDDPFLPALGEVDGT